MKIIRETLDYLSNFSKLRNSLNFDDRTPIKKWLDGNGISNYSINSDLTVDVNGDVFLANRNLSEFPEFIQFETVKGNFYCQNNRLRSLEGAPNYVGKSFLCNGNMLRSLKGAPDTVDGNFFCQNNIREFSEIDIRRICNIKGTIFS